MLVWRINTQGEMQKVPSLVSLAARASCQLSVPPPTQTLPKKRGRPSGSKGSSVTVTLQDARMQGCIDAGRRRPPAQHPLPPPPSALLPVPGRGRGRPPKNLLPPSPAPVGRPSPAAGPRVTKGTQARRTFYLLGKLLHPSSPLGMTKLPKLGPILQKVLGIIEEEKVSRDIAVKRVTKEVKEIWKHHFGVMVVMVIEGTVILGQNSVREDAEEQKMIIRDTHIEVKIRSALVKYKALEYESRRVVRTSLFEDQEIKMKTSLQLPFNIVKAGRWHTKKVQGRREKVWLLSGEEVLEFSGILSWKEDLLHLRNQLTEEQPGTCTSADMHQQKRDIRVMSKEISAKVAREKEETYNKNISAKVQEEDDFVAESSSMEDDEDYKGPVKKKKKMKVMSLVSGTADRLNLSVRKKTMMAASTCNALGIPLQDTNISVASAWRHGHKNRKTVGEGVRKTFDPNKLWFLHWDGKTCKLRMDEKSNFVAIYAVSIDGTKIQKLLDIPRVSSGKAEDEFQVLVAVLKSWGIKKEHILGLVFDTTASNTGEWSGVCR